MDSLIALAKTLLMAFMMVEFGIYEGAVLIALIAAFSRMAYTPENPTPGLFSRFFVMSLSITMIMVHVGLYFHWERDPLVIISGVSAFLSKELLEFLMKSRTSIFKKIAGTFK